MVLMRCPGGPPRAASSCFIVVVTLGLVAALAGCASSGRRQTAEAVPNDPELARSLDELATAFQGLDANRILQLYTTGDYALSWDNKVRFATGPAEHLAILGGVLADVKDFKLTMDPNFEAWRDGSRAWTSRKFTLVGTRKNGEKIEFAGWHSAIWEKANGKWLIWYEHLGGGPERPAPPPPPPPAPVVVAAPPPPAVLPFADIFFDFDKSFIRRDQAAALEANIDLLKKNPDIRILVEGHCDERAGETYNFGLGDRRAASTKRFLVDRGIDPARVAVVSYGKQRPFEPGHNEKAWSKNRRAHFVVLKK